MFPLKDNIPTRRFPVVTVALIALNVLVYLFVQRKTGIDVSGNSLDQAQLAKYAAIPYEISHPGRHCATAAKQLLCEGQPGVRGSADGQLPTWATLFTAMFTHAGLLHLGGNVLFLWIFGNNVEDSMGRVRFIVFYLLAGLAALALQTAIEPNAVVPTLGASGAIAGVLGGYLLLYPKARVVTGILLIFFVTLVEIPAFLVLGFWFLQQAAFAALDLTNPDGGGGGVAYVAHVGGFVFGLLAITLFATYRSEVTDAPRRGRRGLLSPG